MPVEEETRRANLMILAANLTLHDASLRTYAMPDTGAEGKRFIDKDWAVDNGFTLQPLKDPIRLETFDGQEAEDGPITHYVQSSMRIQDHLEIKALFLVTRLAHYPVVLGLPWLKMHDPHIGFSSHTVLFDSDFCRQHCNVPLRSSKVHALHDIPRKTTPRHLPARPAGLFDVDVAPVSLQAAAAYTRRGYRLFQVSLETFDEMLKPDTAPPDDICDDQA